MVAAGEIKLGELVGFLFYLTLFYEPVGRLQAFNQMLQSARAASERVFFFVTLLIASDLQVKI